MKRWRGWRQSRFNDRLFLEATAEVFSLRSQVTRLKDTLERDRRDFAEERREWQRKEKTYVEANHDIAAKLASSDGQLIAYGQEHR